MAQLQNEDRDVWSATTLESLARYQNHNYLLQALTAHILMEPSSPRMTSYRDEIVKLLATR